MTWTSALLRGAGAVAAVALVSACSGPSTPLTPGGDAAGTPSASSQAPFTGQAALKITGTPGTPQDVVTGLRVPWTIVPLPDGTALVTERDSGRVLRVGSDGSQRQVLATGPAGAVPGVVARGRGGLLGMATSPGFATDGAVYAFITTATDDRVVRMTLTGGAPGTPDGGALSDPQPVLTGIPAGPQDHGGRIAFGPDGMLYVAVGDNGNPAAAQDPSSLLGKVLRITPDGQPAPGNPAAGSPVWASGFHDPEGLAWDDLGRMYGTDQGLDQQDELDALQAGGNYGWPLVQGNVGPQAAKDSHTAPLMTWYFKDAEPQGLLVTGDAVYISGSRNRLWRVPRYRDTLGKAQPLYQDVYGRMRDIAAGPDGTLWMLTSNTDPFVRVTIRPGDDRLVRLPLG